MKQSKESSLGKKLFSGLVVASMIAVVATGNAYAKGPHHNKGKHNQWHDSGDYHGNYPSYPYRYGSGRHCDGDCSGRDYYRNESSYPGCGRRIGDDCTPSGSDVWYDYRGR